MNRCRGGLSNETRRRITLGVCLTSVPVVGLHRRLWIVVRTSVVALRLRRRAGVVSWLRRGRILATKRRKALCTMVDVAVGRVARGRSNLAWVGRLGNRRGALNMARVGVGGHW